MESAWILCYKHYASKASTISITTFKSFFKLTPRLVDVVWKKLISTTEHCQQKHLLWTLYYLKTQNSNDTEIAAVLSTNRETLMLKVESTVRQLFQALPEVHFFYFFSFFLVDFFCNYYVRVFIFLV